MNRLAAFAPQVLSLLRIISALSFMTHGTMKLFGFPQAMEGVPPEMKTLMLVAGILEVVGGGLLAIGLFTRPVAFILSGMMAVAYFMAHATKGFYPALNGGEPAMLFCFIFLYIACAGGGPWSVDALIRKRP